MKWGACWGTAHALPTLPPPRGRGGNPAGFRSRCWARRWAGVCKSSQLCPGSCGRATPHLPAEISPATHLWFLQLQAAEGTRGARSAVQHQLPVADLARTRHWDHRNGGWAYMARESCQKADSLPSQSLVPFFPFMPYAVLRTARSTDARVRSVLPSRAFGELSTKWWTPLPLIL